MPRLAARSSTELARYLRTETVGGALLLLAAAIALVWVNTPAGDSYQALRDFHLGPTALQLNLSIDAWAQDGLLAVFFFIAGIEVKREMVVGELSDRKSATLPVVAALGGVLTPALVALAVGWHSPDPGYPPAPGSSCSAWPWSTTWWPSSSSPCCSPTGLRWVGSRVALGCLAVYAYAQLRRVTWTALYAPLALLTWYAVHQTGIHATFAGVALGLLTRVRSSDADRARGEQSSPASRLEHRIQPFSAGFCVPLFALFAAGVPLTGAVLAHLPHDRIAVAIVAGLLFGKVVGIFGTSWLAIKLGLAGRPRSLGNRDLLALSVLGGIGFTVSLLVAELGLGEEAANAKAAVLIASAIASVLGAAMLVRRGRVFHARHAALMEHKKRHFYEVFDAEETSPAAPDGA